MRWINLKLFGWGDASIASPFTSKLSSVMAGKICWCIKLTRQRFCKSSARCPLPLAAHRLNFVGLFRYGRANAIFFPLFALLRRDMHKSYRTCTMSGYDCSRTLRHVSKYYDNHMYNVLEFVFFPVCHIIKQGRLYTGHHLTDVLRFLHWMPWCSPTVRVCCI